MLGVWAGDMTIKTKKDKKILTFRKSDKTSLETNFSISGLASSPAIAQTQTEPTTLLNYSSTTALATTSVSGAGLLVCDGPPGDTGCSPALDCLDREEGVQVWGESSGQMSW